jgi:uncharacterized membrane protein YvbJ
MMKCNNCGEQNRPDVKFCENCGEPLNPVKDKQPVTLAFQGIVCSNCGSENRGGVKFCEECGTPLIEELVEQDTGILKTESLLDEEILEIPVEEKEEEAKEPEEEPLPEQETIVSVEVVEKALVQEKLQVCPRCGFDNRSEVRFCESCGELLIKPVKEKVQIPRKKLEKCPQCGFENDKKAAKCENCGYAFVSMRKQKRVKIDERRIERSTPDVGIEKRWKLQVPKLTSRSLLWILVGVVVFVAGYFMISSLVVKLTRHEAQQLANTVVYSSYPEFNGVKPFVEHSKEGRQYFSTYSYSMNVTGKIEGGGAVEFTRYIVIQVNRSEGDFQILSAY